MPVSEELKGTIRNMRSKRGMGGGVNHMPQTGRREGIHDNEAL